MIHTEDMSNSSLNFLYDMRESFYNYRIIRAYNGFCRRDIRELPKYDNLTKGKKIAHIYRGHEFCKMIVDNRFNPMVAHDMRDEIIRIKNITTYSEQKELINGLKNEVSAYREYISKLHDTGIFPMFMTPENQKKLDNKIAELIQSNLWKTKAEWSMNLEEVGFYIANENPEINYK